MQLVEIMGEKENEIKVGRRKAESLPRALSLLTKSWFAVVPVKNTRHVTGIRKEDGRQVLKTSGMSV